MLNKAILFLCLFILAGCEKKCELSISNDFQRTDENILTLSREVLLTVDIEDANTLMPVPFWSSPYLMIDRGNNGNRMTSLWHDPKNTKVFEYIVYLDFGESKVIGTVHRAK